MCGKYEYIICSLICVLLPLVTAVVPWQPEHVEHKRHPHGDTHQQEVNDLLFFTINDRFNPPLKNKGVVIVPARTLNTFVMFIL